MSIQVFRELKNLRSLHKVAISLAGLALICSVLLLAWPSSAFAVGPKSSPSSIHYSVTIIATAQGPHGKQSKSLVLAWLSPGGNAGFSAGATAQMYKTSLNAVNCMMPFARPGRHQVRLQCNGSFFWSSSDDRLDYRLNTRLPLNQPIVVFRSRNRHDVRYQVKVLVKKVA